MIATPNILLSSRTSCATGDHHDSSAGAGGRWNTDNKVRRETDWKVQWNLAYIADRLAPWIFAEKLV